MNHNNDQPKKTMKNTTLLLPWIALTCLPLQAKEWNFDQPEALQGWGLMGRVEQSTNGLIMGPSEGNYTNSGIRSQDPVARWQSRKINLKVEMTALTVENPAPDDLENENDMRIDIVLNPLPTIAWESSAAVINVALLFNSRNQSIYAGLFSKGEGLPREAPKLLTGEFLGEGSGKGDIGVEISVDQDAIIASFLCGEEPPKTLRAPLTENLRQLLEGSLHLVIYQQNIGPGSGEFTLRKVSLD